MPLICGSVKRCGETRGDCGEDEDVDDSEGDVEQDELF